MGYLNEKIRQLEQELMRLKSEVAYKEEFSSDSNDPKPYSIVGGEKDKTFTFPVDIRTGLGGSYGNFLPWNDAELKLPPYGEKPDDPTEGYHKHTHSRFAGGALNIEYLELVKYNVDDWDTDENYNPHCQQFWIESPPIEVDSNGEEKISNIFGLNSSNTNKPNMVWDKISKCWRFYAVYAKDIEE